eukprot:COSAG01_NODE_12173_length_1786_cov_5.368109_2_plen_72_part_01
MHAQERLTAAEPLESAELERSARTDVDGGEVDRPSGELPRDASPVSAAAAVVVGGCGGLRRGGRPTADEARR